MTKCWKHIISSLRMIENLADHKQGRHSEANMVSIVKLISPSLSLLACGWLIAIVIYYVFQSPALSSASFSFSRCSSSPCKPITNAITIDRDLFDYLSYHLREATYGGVDNYTRFMTADLGLKELTDVEPLVAGMGPVINDVTSFEYPISIAPCREKVKNTSQRTLFVAVISAPNNFEKRATIRRTWPSHLENQSNIDKQLDVVGFGFVVGLTKNQTVQQKLIDEYAKHSDILQVNVYDQYRNLSVKAAGLLNWVNSRCSQVDFVLKVDDDVYVNVHNLATVLHSFSPSEPNVYGHKVGGNHPSRTEGKWPSSFKNWPWLRLPHFLQGAGIVIAGSAVRPLLAAVQTTPYFIWDDVYLTGLCAVKARLPIRISDRFFVDRPEMYADPCFVRSAVMWTSPSADHTNSSHFVSHNLYRNPAVIHCVLINYVSHNKTVVTFSESLVKEPAIPSEFPFGFINQT